MKKLLLVLILLVSAGSLLAADLEVTGDAYIRGTTLDNMALVEEDQVNYNYFDYDLNLNLTLIANQKATVFAKLTYDKDVGTNGVVKDSAEDSNLTVERAYLNYKFHPALQVNTGLMAGGKWGYSFGNTEKNVMRLQAIGALSKDMIFIYTYEKQDDQGQEYTKIKNAEKYDTTVNYLAGIFNFGPVKVQPLFVYGKKGINADGKFLTEKYTEYIEGKAAELGKTKDEAASIISSGAFSTADAFIAHKVGGNESYVVTTAAFDLAIGGDFKMFGFESEFVYKNTNSKDLFKDHKTLANAGGIYKGATMGCFVDLFANIKPAKVGFVYAYGSSDKEKGSYNWGDDFDVLIVMDDYITDNPKEYNLPGGLTGYSVYKLYGSATFDKITAGMAIGYGKDNANWKEAKNGDKIESYFLEYDMNVSYAINENATYSIAGGLAEHKTNNEENGNKVGTDAWRIYHKISVKF